MTILVNKANNNWCFAKELSTLIIGLYINVNTNVNANNSFLFND